MRILLSGMIISFGLSSLFAAQAQQKKVSDGQVAAMVEAFRQVAPKNTPNDGLYSDWQLQPATVKLWTTACLKKELTPEQFESDRATARQVVSCAVRRELNRQSRAIPGNETAVVGSVACWWLTGKYSGCDSGAAASFVTRVTKNYKTQVSKLTPDQPPEDTAVDEPSKPASDRPASKPKPEPATQASEEPSKPASDRPASKPKPKPATQTSQQRASASQVNALVEAFRLAAPKNLPNDGLYSDWQVQPETIKFWTSSCLKKTLTPAQFDSDPATAREVVSCVVRRELNRQFRAIPNNETAAVGSVACWWISGNYTGCGSGSTANFVKRVTTNYQRQRSKS